LVTRTSSFTATRGCCGLAGGHQNITLHYKNTCGLAGGSPDDAVIRLVSAGGHPDDVVIRQEVTRTSSFTATRGCCDLAGSHQNITLRYKNTCGLAGGSPDDAVIRQVVALMML
jgi:hypothetical protein